MKSLGIVRRVDPVGRIVLPKELRRLFNLESENDSVEIFVDEDKIILKKYIPACIFCGSADDIIEYEGQKICKACAEKIGKKTN
ncbi:MAG: AbrB/MazE/SpoVT family DNA-binding domain-containing protein [Clostridiales bacterium]|nr:AbrB/MazE/SpoVT family DNA-binding domain-containing protein [Clostridiales bacterium]